MVLSSNLWWKQLHLLTRTWGTASGQRRRAMSTSGDSKRTAKSTAKKEQNYDAFLVIDLEATCDQPLQPDPMEVIEFPVLVVNAVDYRVEATFHKYVKPKIHPQLSPFCVNLTGILQEMVDEAETFDRVFNEFNEWIYGEAGLMCPETDRPLRRFTFVACGNWDFQLMLPQECERSKLRIPQFMRSWINLKKAFAEATGHWPKDFVEMLKRLDIEHKGHLHSGIDDCTNTVRILAALAAKGYQFNNTHMS